MLVLLLLGGCPTTVVFPPVTPEDSCTVLASDTGSPKVRFEVGHPPHGGVCWWADL